MAKNRALVAVAFVVVVPLDAYPVTTSLKDYSIAAIESDLSPMDKVGPLRAGMLCLPKGKLLWRDIARPTDQVAIGIVSRRMSVLGLQVPDVPDRLFSDVAPLTKYRIRVTYESLAMKLCIPGLGIGEKHPSGTGQMLVRWETFDQETRMKVDTQSFDVTLLLDGRDARTDPTVVGDVLKDSADQYVSARHRSYSASPR